jgi:hypothetical protein
VVGNILLFFYKKKTKQNKKNNKILPATSACCEAVVRNECRDHFSKKKTENAEQISIVVQLTYLNSYCPRGNLLRYIIFSQFKEYAFPHWQNDYFNYSFNFLLLLEGI